MGGEFLMKSRALKAKIARIFLRLLGWDDIVYEKDVPEFYISKHGEQRLKERLKCSDKKLEKLVRKAWVHGNLISNKKNLIKKSGRKIYKEYMGYIFIFKIIPTKRGLKTKMFITVLLNKFIR